MPARSSTCRSSSAASTSTSGGSSTAGRLRNAWTTHEEVPAQTPVSNALSKDLRKRGFTFVGPTICYAHMQATGMVNDHLVGCFRHREVRLMAE